jgi:hypothetical protein
LQTLLFPDAHELDHGSFEASPNIRARELRPRALSIPVVKLLSKYSPALNLSGKGERRDSGHRHSPTAERTFLEWCCSPLPDLSSARSGSPPISPPQFILSIQASNKEYFRDIVFIESFYGVLLKYDSG